MSKMMENVKTLNSVVRTGIFAIVMGGLGYGGYVGYYQYVKPGIDAKVELDQLRTDFELQSEQLTQTLKENDQLRTSNRLLKVDRRLANVEILDTGENEDGEPTMLVRFTELDVNNQPIGAPKDFELRGDRMYVDCWVVKFDDKYIEQADALRSASLCVFKSIFGNLDGPEGSQSLDTHSQDDFPAVYSDDEKSRFEQQIWGDFWRLANDERSQEELGIRAIHGQANYLKVQKGKVYKVTVRSSGAASLEPVTVQ